MRIKRLKFRDASRNWKLEDLEFKKLTLLVGASGVGKTQILRAVMALSSIASGKSLNGVRWYVEFTSADESLYIWEGEFENSGRDFFFHDEFDSDKKAKSKIIYEKLSLNNKIIVDRNKSKIVFSGKETIKLSQQESVISLLREENLVAPARVALGQLVYSDQSNSQERMNFYGGEMTNIENLSKKYKTLKSLQESGLDGVIKLAIASKAHKRIFSAIKSRFIDIFPQTEDIKIAPLDPTKDEIPSFFRDSPFVQIKERNVDNWIRQSNISSGMFRTLMQISEIYLCADGTAFLIDEFENSLGVNCLDELTVEILKSKRDIQFILTSHHPYIINNIPFENWKLVTRRAGVVKTHDASEFNLGNSKHDAFMQLMQLEQFQSGLEE